METKEILHPSKFIIKDDADVLRNYAAEAEKTGHLHPAQIELIYNRRWFRLFVPSSYNGLELSLPQALQTEESIAWADGSTGWTVTLCSGANWFIGFLPEDTAKLLFNDHKVCLAGSGRQSGTASIKDNGYIINGQWDYATGAPHATAFTANCIIEKEGVPVLNEDGTPLTHSFVFLKEEVTLIENWQKMGMIATASKSYTVKDLYVDKNREFNITSSHAILPHPVFQYPFLEFACATLAINSSGMAMRFIDLAGKIFADRNKEGIYKNEVLGFLNKTFESTSLKMKAARYAFYTAVDVSWDSFLKNKEATPEQLRKVRATSYQLAKCARSVTDELYPLCGLAAANTDTEINRVWRNLHTASQHALLSIFMAGEFHGVM